MAPPAPAANKPPPSKPGPRPAPRPRDDERRRARTAWLTRAGYFLVAVLLHLVVFLILATRVVFREPVPPAAEFSKTYVPSGGPPPPPPETSQETMPVPTHMAPAVAPIRTVSQEPTLNIPLPEINPGKSLNAPGQTLANNAPKVAGGLPSRMAAIRATETTNWNRTMDNIRESGGDPHNVVATFPVYLASYADGDWKCNVHMAGGEIDAGSLPDLVAKMNEWSHGNLKGKVIPTPLDIGGPDLLAKMPPFIFFTGHKDFHLTPTEIENLQKYLQNGGAIWGDNALAGSGSRFDVAFKREMKLVIPDVDKNFAEVPLTHDIFTKSWFPIDKVPEGMNYYAEPLQSIDIDGKLAVIYTPNDYSDLYWMRILPGDTDMAGFVAKPGFPLFTNRQFWNFRTEFYRNFELASSLQAQQLGMNIIGFLLVRFDKDLMLSN